MSRIFYGPLERSSDYEERNTTIMKHPEDATKLVRYGRDGEYYDSEEMARYVQQTQQTLAGLAAFGVRHVEPQYIDESTLDGTARLVTVVDKIEHDDALEIESSSDVFSAKNRVLTQMLAYTAHVARKGGYIDAEMMHLEQFTFDGRDMVLVDIEPIGSSEFIHPAVGSVDVDGTPGHLLFSTARLIRDVLELPEEFRDEPTVRAAARAVELLPGESPQVDEVKVILLASLDAGAMSIEASRLARGQAMDNDEEGWD